jgi:hypothetical protein
MQSQIRMWERLQKKNAVGASFGSIRGLYSEWSQNKPEGVAYDEGIGSAAAFGGTFDLDC